MVLRRNYVLLIIVAPTADVSNLSTPKGQRRSLDLGRVCSTDPELSLHGFTAQLTTPVALDPGEQTTLRAGTSTHGHTHRYIYITKN